MGEEVDDFQVFRWPLKDYRRMDKKTLSPEFSCGGHKWCVFPRGCSSSLRSCHLSESSVSTCGRCGDSRDRC